MQYTSVSGIAIPGQTPSEPLSYTLGDVEYLLTLADILAVIISSVGFSLLVFILTPKREQLRSVFILITILSFLLVHYRNVLALIAFLEFLSHFYHDEVFIEGESTIVEYKKDVDVYIKYYEEYKAKNKDEIRLPVLVICSYCSALKDNNGEWHHVIDILPSIPLNATFTHSICDKCLEKATKEATESLYDKKTDWRKRIHDKLRNYGIFGIKKRLS